MKIKQSLGWQSLQFRIFMIPSAFFNRILSIVFCCSYEEVIWINAWRVVASMANKFTDWNWTILEHPRNSMGFSQLGLESDDPVPFFRFPPRPNPALWSFFNTIPKTHFSGRASIHIRYFINFTGARNASTPLAMAAPA